MPAQPDNRLTEHDVEQMVVATTLGREVIPTNEAARRTWEAIQRDVAAIMARGGTVEIPHDVP
jgi:hypothetical protein